MRNCLVIGDTQIPFHNPGALDFCVRIKKEYKIADVDVYHVGDETDQYFGGMYKKDPNGAHSALSEMHASIEELKRWYKAFPEVKLALSNHGTRWLRKATEAEIPSQMLRKYEEVIQAPPGWRWKKDWKSNTKRPFIVEHGDDYGGQYPHAMAAINNGCSTVIGHTHTVAGTYFIKTRGLDIWGAATGCLIDFEQYAFNYARGSRRRPQLGVIVILDDGKNPVWVPME